MLLEYGARNYFSFKEGFSVSFRLDQNCPASVSNGKEFTNILGVKGANASGKTNILKALSFLGRFCSDSFQDKPEKLIDVRTFFGNDDSTDFFVEFKTGEIFYRYELEVTTEKVLRETLYRTMSRQSKIIERQENKFTTLVGEFKELKNISLRNNASFISTANQYQFEFIKDIYNFFDAMSYNVHLFGMEESPDVYLVSKLLYENPEYFEFVKEVINSCDVGISDIRLLKINEGQENEYIAPAFSHPINGSSKYLHFFHESSGTQALYLHLARYKFVLDSGSVLIHDEFDVNLHSMILPKLLKLFLDPEVNKKNAQLIFTTHDTPLLDFLGKYRVYMVSKRNNESFAYRLDEIGGDLIRNDRPISPLYSQGRIGGVPILEQI